MERMPGDGSEGWSRSILHSTSSPWVNGNLAGSGSESPIEAPPGPEPTVTPAHYCQAHQTAFRQHSRGEAAWWSHKTADGKWCREK